MTLLCTALVINGSSTRHTGLLLVQTVLGRERYRKVERMMIRCMMTIRNKSMAFPISNKDSYAYTKLLRSITT